MKQRIGKAERISGIGEYYFSGKLAQIRQMNREGREVINLGIGSPDLPPHPEVLKVLTEYSMKKDSHGYQSYMGHPEMREAVAAWYAEYFRVSLDPSSQILPVMGSKEGILQLSLAYLNPGDRVLVPDPGYPAYAAIAALAGAGTLSYRLEEKKAWMPDLDKLEKSGLAGVKMMWVNYPHMPTGQPADPAFFAELREFAQRNGILVCNDNPYSFILNERPMSILSAEGPVPGVVELNSLSKSHNMAGWRIGFILADEQHIRDALLVSSNYQSGMFLALQLAAARALELDRSWYRDLNREYRERRVPAGKIMKTLGCSFDPNQQGMFLWGRLPGNNPDDREFSDRLLEQASVFITPGTVFGSGGKGYIRISLCSPAEILEKANERIVHL